jgi:hypothetical protein
MFRRIEHYFRLIDLSFVEMNNIYQCPYPDFKWFSEL